MKITVYEKPTCTTCRNLTKLFIDNGVDWDKVNYFIEPFTIESLGKLLKKAQIRPFDAMRKGEAAFKESGFTADTPDDNVLALIVANPNVLQRPIVEVGNRAVMARPIERALELLGK